jgi:hypothetical protein
VSESSRHAGHGICFVWLLYTLSRCILSSPTGRCRWRWRWRRCQCGRNGHDALCRRHGSLSHDAGSTASTTTATTATSDSNADGGDNHDPSNEQSNSDSADPSTASKSIRRCLALYLYGSVLLCTNREISVAGSQTAGAMSLAFLAERYDCTSSA